MYSCLALGPTQSKSILIFSAPSCARGRSDGRKRRLHRPHGHTGHTTISGTIYGGLPVPVSFDSPDLNGNLAVSLADFAKFSRDFNAPADFDPSHDFNEDGATNVADLTIFAGYFNASQCG